MRDNTARLQTSSSLAADPRWELVERIISSSAFIKSPRLCSFLVYVCDLSLHGRGDEINEVNIGKALFDRAPDYDSSVDGIVRSHASRLRQRLEQYFNEEGAHETVRLLIPKGGYMPFFEERSPALAPVPLSFPSAPDLRPAKQTSTGDRRLRLIQFLGAALALACVAILCLAVRLRERAGPQMVTIRNPLWARLFPPDRSTMIVASDTGLTSLRTLTGKNRSSRYSFRFRVIMAHPVWLAFKNGGGTGPSTNELTVSFVVDFGSGMRAGSIKYSTSQLGITKSGGVLIRQVTRSR